MAGKLLSASLAVLIDSIYLVIGPAGVPVSVLREDKGRNDVTETVTNVCRKAMFGILNTLKSINGKHTTMKNEAIIALSKIAAFCKSENAVGGITGTVVSRRKALLKDIWDACLQANMALGGALQM